MDLSFGPTLRGQIEKNLNAFSRQSTTSNELRDAAVCLIVVGGWKEARLLLTKRPIHMNRHAGQYALPGGRLEPGETFEFAALRELDEEMGLKLHSDDILGYLDEYPTRSGFRILPIVIWGPTDAQISPDSEEVAKVYYIPLSELTSPELPEFHQTNNSEYPVLSVNLPSTNGSVFAPTAAMLYQFREVALLGRFTRVSHFRQPQFAWR